MAHRPAKPASRRRSAKAPAFSATGSSRGSASDQLREAGLQIGFGVEEVGHSGVIVAKADDPAFASRQAPDTRFAGYDESN